MATVEEGWKNLEVIAKKSESKMGKKKLWEADLKSFLESLKAAKEMVAQFFLYFTRHVCDKASEFTNKTMRE